MWERNVTYCSSEDNKLLLLPAINGLVGISAHSSKTLEKQISNSITFFCFLFQFPVTVKEYGAVTDIDFSPLEPYNFAVSSSTRVSKVRGCLRQEVEGGIVIMAWKPVTPRKMENVDFKKLWWWCNNLYWGIQNLFLYRFVIDKQNKYFLQNIFWSLIIVFICYFHMTGTNLQSLNKPDREIFIPV